MRNLVAPAAACAAFAMLCSATPALAAAAVTYVSGAGADSGSCAYQSPCRTFAYAVTQTSAGGEIQALDPADYGPVTIKQAVSITGVEGASIDSGDSVQGYAITIYAGPQDAVNIANLILDGRGVANSGIGLRTGGSVTIKNCIARRFQFNGVRLDTSATTPNLHVLIEDVTASENGAAGVFLNPASGVVLGVLNRYTAHNNGYGVSVAPGTAYVAAVDSVIADNTVSGLWLLQGNTFRLEHTKVIQNAIGLNLSKATVESAVDNFIYGNAGHDIIGGSLIDVGTR